MVGREQLDNVAFAMGLHDAAKIADAVGVNPVALKHWAQDRFPDSHQGVAFGVLLGMLLSRAGTVDEQLHVPVTVELSAYD